MEEKLSKWGFHDGVYTELKRLKLDWDILRFFSIDDFKFCKTNLSHGILSRLCKYIEEERKSNECGFQDSLIDEEPAYLFDGVVDPKNIHAFSEDEQQSRGMKRPHNDDQHDSDSEESSINSPAASKRLQLAVTPTVRKQQSKKSTKPAIPNSNNPATSTFGLSRKIEKSGNKYHKSQVTSPIASTSKTGSSATVTESTHQSIVPQSSCNVLHKAFRLNETNVSVEAIKLIILDSCEGQCLLQNYKKNDILEPHERDTLTDIIINRCGPLARGTGNFFSTVAEAINSLMVNENKSIYYVAPRQDGNDSKNPKGKLPDKWRNIMNKLISTGVIQKERKSINTNIEDDEEDIELPDDLIGPVKWLSTNRKPWDQVKSNWELTHEYRVKILVSKTFDEILQHEWPILNSDLGPQLIQVDFQLKYPEASFAFEKKWLKFFEIIYNLKKKNIRSPSGVRLCRVYDNVQNVDKREDLDGLRILILPHLMPLTGKIKTGCGSKRISIVDSTEGFVVWCKSIHDVSAKLELRASRYKEWKLKVQPVLVIIGEKIEEPETCYISLNEILWEIEKPAHALDTIFQLLMLLNLSYPEDCAHIWTVLQKTVYDIDTDFDKFIPCANQIITTISQQLKRNF